MKITCKLLGHKFWYVVWYETGSNFPHWEYLCERCGGVTGSSEYVSHGKNKIMNTGEALDKWDTEYKFSIKDTYII